MHRFNFLCFTNFLIAHNTDFVASAVNIYLRELFSVLIVCVFYHLFLPF